MPAAAGSFCACRTIAWIAAGLLLSATACSEESQTRLKARLGSAQAQLELGKRAERNAAGGEGRAEAAEWYRKAARAGKN